MSEDGLFSDEGLRVAPAVPEVDDRTHGQKLRDRQQARIAVGLHPLSIGGSIIRLHPDAPRDANKDDDGGYPRCGTCVHRGSVGGHARDFPKCMIGCERRLLTDEERARNVGTWRESATHHSYLGPRVTGSDASDCKAWWPACVDYEPKD